MKRGEHKHLPFGQGDVDVNEALDALREANYNYGVYVELSRESPQEGKRGWVNLTMPEEQASFEDEARALAESAKALQIG